MPYKNIVFIKLEKRLLNDHRWYMMSDSAQLLFIKLILLGAETYNKIPKSDNVLMCALRVRTTITEFEKNIQEIILNFPKFKSNKHYYYFDEFEHKTNYIPDREIPRKSQVLPKVGAYLDKEEEEDKEKIKSKKKSATTTDFQFLESLKNNPAYKHINIDLELGKMDAWLSTRQGRIKTRRFVVNWLNKIDKPLKTISAKREDFTNTPIPERPKIDKAGVDAVHALVQGTIRKIEGEK